MRAFRVLVVIIALIVTTTGCSTGMFSGTRPDNLGVKDGRLAPPNPRPNNVSSQADKADTSHYIEPLRPRGDPVQAFAKVKEIVLGMPRVSVVRNEPDYLWVECRSAMMGFVDDAEFYLDRSAGLIHARSASRLGYGDLGVNRKRIESVRSALAEREAASR